MTTHVLHIYCCNFDARFYLTCLFNVILSFKVSRESSDNILKRKKFHSLQLVFALVTNSNTNAIYQRKQNLKMIQTQFIIHTPSVDSSNNFDENIRLNSSSVWLDVLALRLSTNTARNHLRVFMTLFVCLS